MQFGVCSRTAPGSGWLFSGISHPTPRGLAICQNCPRALKAARPPESHRAVGWHPLEPTRLSEGFAEKPRRDLLTWRFKLWQTRSPWLRAAQTNRSRQQLWTRERGRGDKKPNAKNKQTKQQTGVWKRWPHADGLCSEQRCPAAQGACPCVVQPDSPRAPFARPRWQSLQDAAKARGGIMDFTHRHLWLQVSSVHQPEKGPSDPSLQHYLHLQGVSCLKQGWVAGHRLHFSFTSKLLTVSQR